MNREQGFYGDLVLRHRDKPIDGKWFRTVNSFAYISKTGKEYYVPIFTNTDFASIPKMFRGIISRTGRHGKAAVLHDYLCESRVVPRKEADKVFLEALKYLGVKWWKRRVMYSAVSAYTMVMRNQYNTKG